MHHSIFLFGEAEKGDFCTPILCRSLPQLAEVLGNPPENTRGLICAVQSLLYDRELIYFRVKEEGFSTSDYMRGLKMLHNTDVFSPISAICMPGMGDPHVIDAAHGVCGLYKSQFIMDDKDLYDYLTSLK